MVKEGIVASPENSFIIIGRKENNATESARLVGAAQTVPVHLVVPDVCQEATERHGGTGSTTMRSHQHPLIGSIWVGLQH